MQIEEMYDHETVNKIKRDANNFDFALRGDSGFINLIEKGLVKIDGEKNGELVYVLTEEGHKSAKEGQANGSAERARETLREQGGVRL